MTYETRNAVQRALANDPAGGYSPGRPRRGIEWHETYLSLP
jgi:hypothetical protein